MLHIACGGAVLDRQTAVGVAFCCEVMHELDWESMYGILTNSDTNLIDCRKTCDSELSFDEILTDSECLTPC